MLKREEDLTDDSYEHNSESALPVTPKSTTSTFTRWETLVSTANTCMQWRTDGCGRQKEKENSLKPAVCLVLWSSRLVLPPEVDRADLESVDGTTQTITT